MHIIHARIVSAAKRLHNTIKAQNRNRILVAKWSAEAEVADNWGDKLNPCLIAKLSTRQVLHQSQVFSSWVPVVYWVIGSSLGRIRNCNAVVWGAGFLNADDNIAVKPRAVYAVRGFRSADKLKQLGLIHHDIPVGDPALLMPLLYKPIQEPLHEIGIIPHFRELDLPVVRSLQRHKECKVIDVCGGLQEFCSEILSCRQILSSSLHGLITAHAYGIPARWLRLSARPRGDGFKYHDYLSSVGLDSPEPRQAETVPEILRMALWPPEIGNLPSISALLDACPFISKNVLIDLKSKIAGAYQGRG